MHTAGGRAKVRYGFPRGTVGTREGLLKQDGSGRGTVYFLPSAPAEALGVSSGGLGVSSGGLGASSGGLEHLASMAEAVASKKKAPKILVESTILALCSQKMMTLEELAGLLNRSVVVIRKDYLQPMIKDKRLRYRYVSFPRS